jgi:HSP20 family molecular chaperone IbpA
MTDEPKPDREERLDDVDHLARRLNRVRSLSDLSYFHAALGSPAPTILEEGPTTVPCAGSCTTPARFYGDVEIPGVGKDALDVHARDDRLAIHALRHSGTLNHLDMSLPARIHLLSETPTFRNGVLDVTRLRAFRPDERRGEPDE